MAATTIIVALTEEGAKLARRLSGLFEEVEVHGLEARVGDKDQGFDAVGPHLRSLYALGHPLVVIAAAGIVVRSLAPLIADKRQEPPVLSLAEDGSCVVPLLGGHRGANQLARRLARALGVEAAITTAGDNRFGLALDEPPAGWGISNRAQAKSVMAALLAGDPVALESDLGESIDITWLNADGASFAPPPAAITLRLSEAAVAPGNQSLTLHPKTLVLGVGCERGISTRELNALVDESLAAAGLALQSVACLATIEVKEDEAALRALAAQLALPLRLFSAGELEAETPRVKAPSDYVYRTVGSHSVAEAAALAAVGGAGALVGGKRKSRRGTCAIGRAAAIIDVATVGRGCGRLSIVGIGPGQASWRVPEATAAIRAASDLVGYRLYLDLLDSLSDGRVCHAYELGQEEARVRDAIALAAQGRRVALISSGDAGIYAMASLAFEIIHQQSGSAPLRFEVEVVPGISALQAAAARAGAPLGHDFCAISLSDLMTPAEAIERRLEAAAAGDFVVALYNPVSKGRQALFRRAREILLAARPGETPVVLARNLGRQGETVRHVTLQELAVEDVDMLTLVLIGSTATRSFAGPGGKTTVYTPRGYGGAGERAQ